MAAINKRSSGRVRRSDKSFSEYQTVLELTPARLVSQRRGAARRSPAVGVNRIVYRRILKFEFKVQLDKQL
jgi:hypothetical protein